MDALAPDLSRYWLAGQPRDSSLASAAGPDDEPLSPSQQEALDELAERVNAARSIV